MMPIERYFLRAMAEVRSAGFQAVNGRLTSQNLHANYFSRFFRRVLPSHWENFMKPDYGQLPVNQEPRIPKESYELRTLQSLRRIIRAIEIHSQQLACLHDITGPQLACLLTVKENGPLTSGNVAKTIYLSPSTVVGIIDRLEKKKLVVRERDSRDRRQVFISITPRGEKLIDDTPSLMQNTLAKALVELPELEQISITMALEKLTELIEARHIDAAPMLETGSLTSE
jgi:DNA-binding MarR family transcriptional regulator